MPASYKDNAELIDLLKKGDEHAYVYLVKTYYRRLFVYVLTLSNDHATAEDIVQNVLLKTWEYRKLLDSSYSLKNFLYRTSYNEFINHYKKDRRITELEKAYIEAIDDMYDEKNAEITERKITLINQSLSLLPEKCAEVFLLSKKEGLTNNEIADHLNLSLKTVEGHITKAYGILRKQLSDKIKSILIVLFGSNPST